MSGVLRVTRLDGLLGAQVNGDGNDGQDADVPETRRREMNQIKSSSVNLFVFRVSFSPLG